MQSKDTVNRPVKKTNVLVTSNVVEKSQTSTVVSNVRGRSILGKSDKNVTNVATGIDKKSISD